MTEDEAVDAADVDLSNAREFLQHHMDDHGFLSWLGATVDEVERGRMVMTIPYDEKLTNSGPGSGEDTEGRNTINGGVASTLIDVCGGLAVRASLDDPVYSGVATIDLNVSYLRPARGDLTATADVVRIGGTVGVSRVSVVSDTGDGEKEVAVGRGSFRIFNP
jgi:uncharacterized protein (TIGR00369 family)